MITFSPPHINDKIIEQIIDTLNSGWITTGPKTKLFEQMLTDYSGHKTTLCLNSASAGLELMLRWFGVGPGDEVIIPAYTYAATANVIVHTGAIPVMVDVGNDFNIDISKIESAITTKTKVIIPVDIGGFPCDYNKINELVKQPSIVEKFLPNSHVQKQLGRIMVMSDAAHSIGALYHGRKTGELTDVTVFSFHAVKNITTAEGGAVCLNLPEPFDNEEIYKHLVIKSLHGQTKDALAKAQIGNWKYDIIEPGYKCNMTDIQAAMGVAELDRYDSEIIPKRKQIFDLYSNELSKHDWAWIPEYKTCNKISSFHVYLLRIKGITELQRDMIIQNIFDRGVAVNVHFVPLPLFTYYKNLGYDINNYPVSYKNFISEISLPVYYDLTLQQVQKVIKAVVKSVNEVINL